jgi:hypothetical protein
MLARQEARLKDKPAGALAKAEDPPAIFYPACRSKKIAHSVLPNFRNFPWFCHDESDIACRNRKAVRHEGCQARAD